MPQLLHRQKGEIPDHKTLPLDALLPRSLQLADALQGGRVYGLQVPSAGAHGRYCHASLTKVTREHGKGIISALLFGRMFL